MKRLRRLNVLITGGAGSLGACFAERFVAKGAFVIIVDSNREALAAMRRKLGSNALAMHCNLAREEEIISCIAQLSKKVRCVDVLINNVGISPKRSGKKIPVWELTEKDWHEVFAVNLISAALMLRYTLPFLGKSAFPTIVNIGSIMAKLGSAGPLSIRSSPVSPSGAHYCCAKAALLCLTKCFARELAPRGITCNSVSPGAIDGGMLRSVNLKSIARQMPLARLARTSEVAVVVEFLASRDARYITGENVDVNGGWLMD